MCQTVDKVRKKKRGVQFLQYDYEAAYNKSIEDMDEWFIENMLKHSLQIKSQG